MDKTHKSTCRRRRIKEKEKEEKENGEEEKKEEEEEEDPFFPVKPHTPHAPLVGGFEVAALVGVGPEVAANGGGARGAALAHRTTCY